MPGVKACQRVNMMRKQLVFLPFFLALLLAFATAAMAAEDAPAQKKRPRSLFGAPVNVNIAGGGSLPKGTALTMINASFADKSSDKEGYGGHGMFSQSWLLKIRYGVTNHFEIATTVPYITNKRYGDNAAGANYTQGFSDPVVQMTIAPWNQHQGDPVSAGVTLGLLLPLGTQGKNHLPGVGAWGGRAAAGVGKWVTKDIKLDTEVVWSGPFERGNQKVKRGDQFQWNVNARYLFTYWDIGLESTLIHQESGDRRLPTGKTGLRNGYTEWFVGPSVNVAIEPLDMWVGVGAFFAVLQDYKGPSPAEDARFELKIGKIW